MEVSDPNENPYVAVVSRKCRNLRKKLNNVQKIETQREQGKGLNAEQIAVLATKANVEKSLADVESLKNQLEEIAKAESMKIKDTSDSESKTAEQSTATLEVQSSVTATQYEAVITVDCGTESEIDHVKVDESTVKALDEVLIYKLLKLLHVCSRYNSMTGKILPPDVDYFGQCLMGATSISSFKETLKQSTRNAELYLDPQKGSTYEAIRGMSYVQVANIIDDLAIELGEEDTVAEVDMIAFTDSPTELHAPHINFFAESGAAEVESNFQDLYISGSGLNSQAVQNVIEEVQPTKKAWQSGNNAIIGDSDRKVDSNGAGGETKPKRERSNKPRGPKKEKPVTNGDGVAKAALEGEASSAAIVSTNSSEGETKPRRGGGGRGGREGGREDRRPTSGRGDRQPPYGGRGRGEGGASAPTGTAVESSDKGVVPSSGDSKPVTAAAANKPSSGAGGGRGGRGGDASGRGPRSNAGGGGRGPSGGRGAPGGGDKRPPKKEGDAPKTGAPKSA